MIFLPLALACAPTGAVEINESPVAWQPMTVDVRGPMATETDISPNPFLDVRLDITMISPTGETYRVPGFFDGNGTGGGSGDLWRARFTPDVQGQWQYSVTFLEGSNIAVANDISEGSPLFESGATGTFMVGAPDPDAEGYLATGRLAYVGEHYLKQANGDYWIKGGVDSPENFFGYAGFDNTINQPGGAGTNGLVDGVHRYEPHRQDWNSGDPLFTSADTGIDSKGIIGAINYLASQDVNSLYFLPMNLEGDGRETYPFVGPSGSAFDNTHYDISKLHQWNQVLEHLQRRGLAAHVVLNEREIGNTEWLDEGELGIERKLYYRELVARFTYLNALKWNLSEESRFDADHHKAFARHLRSLDWAAHPVAVHTVPNAPWRAYNDLLGETDFDITSIQYSPHNADEFTEVWRKRSRDAGWPWVIDMDEIGPAGVGLTDSNADELRRTVLYPVYFSGGNLEWYFGYHALPLGGDMRTEDFRTREDMYRYMRHARRFMLQHLPFVEMVPNDDALSDASEGDQVFSKAGEVHAVYLTDGNVDARLAVTTGNWRMRWFDPRVGEFVGAPAEQEGPELIFGQAPADMAEDWVVLVENAAVATPIAEPETSGGNDSEGSSTEDTGNQNAGTDDTDSEVTGTEGSGAAGTDAPEPELGAATESPDTTGNSDSDANADSNTDPGTNTESPVDPAPASSTGGAFAPLMIVLFALTALMRRRRCIDIQSRMSKFSAS